MNYVPRVTFAIGTRPIVEADRTRPTLWLSGYHPGGITAFDPLHRQHLR